MEKLPFVKIFKELGEYIGKKIDAGVSRVEDSIRNTPQKIQIDLSDTSNRIVELKEALSEEIATMTETLAECSVDNYRNVEEACASLCASIERLENEFNGKDFNITVPDVSPAINELKGSISKAIEAVKKESAQNATKIKEAMGDIADSITGLEASIPQIKPVDFTPVELGIERIVKAVSEKNNDRLEAKIDELIQVLKTKELSVPKVFKIDDMQVRAMTHRGGGSVSVNGGQLAARNVQLSNLSISATNTEYSYVFPANTVAWTIKLREQGVLGYYSFTTGTLPTTGGGGDGSKYATIPQNFLQSQSGVDWSGKTIYLGAESASQVAEITVYSL